MMKINTILEMGDEITVNGQVFVLVEMTEKLNEPAKVVFKQPVEFMEKQ